MSKWVCREVERIYLKKCNLYKDLGQIRLKWLDRIHVVDLNTVGQGFDDDDDDDIYN